MPAIKAHKTKVDASGEWDGPRAVAEAPNDEAVLRYMHAWYAGSEPERKGSYKFPHHAPGTDTAAVIAGVNNALARLSQADIPAEDRAGVEAHLRGHRKDAGLDEAMSEAEIVEVVKRIKDVDDLRMVEANKLRDAVMAQEIKEVAFIEENDGMYIPLIEKAVRRDKTIPIKIIQPGWGSSGYYPAEVLKRDGAKAFPKGTKMFWNHPTMSEELERPERDLNDMAAVLVSDARWDDNGPRGAGLYADARVFEHYEKAVDDLAEHIGVSIRAVGKAQQGEVDGRSGTIIKEITAGKSVDFVTAAGAGGEIISLFEAARTPPPTPPQMAKSTQFGEGGETESTGTVPKVTEAEAVSAQMEATNVAIDESEETMELKALQEKVATLETEKEALVTENARLKETNAIRDAKDAVLETLAEATYLPEATKTRLLESLIKNPPMKDGALDKDVFIEKIKEAVKAEVKYLETVLGKGQIRGLGESQRNDEEAGGEKLEASLAESFAALGWSESGAKIAAKGRG